MFILFFLQVLLESAEVLWYNFAPLTIVRVILTSSLEGKTWKKSV